MAEGLRPRSKAGSNMNGEKDIDLTGFGRWVSVPRTEGGA